MKNVKKSASPTSTWLGGICCVASAVLTNDKTIIIRAKDVIKIKIAGANDKTVNKKHHFDRSRYIRWIAVREKLDKIIHFCCAPFLSID